MGITCIYGFISYPTMVDRLVGAIAYRFRMCVVAML